MVMDWPVLPMTVEALSYGLESMVVDATEAVSLKTAPLGRLLGTETGTVKTSWGPLAAGIGDRRDSGAGGAGRQQIAQDDVVSVIGAVVGQRDGVADSGARRDGGR